MVTNYYGSAGTAASPGRYGAKGMPHSSRLTTESEDLPAWVIFRPTGEGQYTVMGAVRSSVTLRQGLLCRLAHPDEGELPGVLTATLPHVSSGVTFFWWRSVKNTRMIARKLQSS